MKKKVVFIIIAGLALRIFFSCCRTITEYYTEMDLNQLQISNVNNASPDYNFPLPLESDSMLSSAIAFTLTLKDSMLKNDDRIYFSKLGFGSAMALTCPEYHFFRYNVTITKIEIFTLYDINENILKNNPVTQLFVALPSDNYLYKTIDQIYPLINKTTSIYPELKFSVFCTEDIRRDSVKFNFKITLSDERVLSADSNTIFLTQTSAAQ